MSRLGVGDAGPSGVDRVRSDRRRGPRGVARLVGAVLAAVALAGVSAAPAAAEEQPSILKAYGLDWIERVREDAWPQPKEQRPIICLLDTGVAVTPDTPEDNPLGPIVARLALDGGTGLPQGTEFEHLHGTQMASVIAAPRNGYGTVGVFPQARIVSVRVTEGAATFITPAAVEAGVRACRAWVVSRSLAIGSVVMAESNYEQREVDAPRWEKAANLAAQSQGAFVAAAGNSPEASALPPASVDSVLVVAAGDDAGAPCPFASMSSAKLVLGPGCSIEAGGGRSVWPMGSSAATAVVGALVAALATRDPTRSAVALVASVRSSMTSTSRVDGRGASDAFAGFIIEPPAVPPNPVVAESSGGTSVTRGSSGQTPEPAEPAFVRQELWRPKVTAFWDKGVLELKRLDRKQKGQLRVAITLRSGQRRERVLKGRVARWKLERRPSRLDAWAEGVDGSVWRSLTSRVRVEV